MRVRQCRAAESAWQHLCTFPKVAALKLQAHEVGQVEAPRLKYAWAEASQCK